MHAKGCDTDFGPACSMRRADPGSKWRQPAALSHHAVGAAPSLAERASGTPHIGAPAAPRGRRRVFHKPMVVRISPPPRCMLMCQSRAALGHDLFEALRRFDLLAIDLDDDIARLDADAAGVGIKLRFEDHDALRLRNGKLVGNGG